MLTTVKQILLKIYDNVVAPIFYGVMSLVYKIKPFKVVYLVSSRIGHLLGSTEIYLRYQKKYVKDGKMLIFVGGRPCNRYFLKILKRKHNVITNVFLRRMFFVGPAKVKYLDPIGRMDFHTLHDKVNINDMDPYLSFTDKEQQMGRELLRKMDIKQDWYVCLHSRDNSFLEKQKFHKGNFSYHSYRDCNIENYFPAAKFCADNGGAVIKMGEIEDETKEYPDYIIDYTKTQRSEFGDLYLPAHTKFFLGNTSGLLNAASIFNVPVAAANFIPIDAALRGQNDIFIPKKIWSQEERRLLTYKEIIKNGYHRFITSEEYSRNGLEVIENSPDEILGLVKEMYYRLNNEWEDTEEDKLLQQKYKSLFTNMDGAYNFQSRVGAYFLRSNKELLDNVNVGVN